MYYKFKSEMCFCIEEISAKWMYMYGCLLQVMVEDLKSMRECAQCQ